MPLRHQAHRCQTGPMCHSHSSMLNWLKWYSIAGWPNNNFSITVTDRWQIICNSIVEQYGYFGQTVWGVIGGRSHPLVCVELSDNCVQVCPEQSWFPSKSMTKSWPLHSMWITGPILSGQYMTPRFLMRPMSTNILTILANFLDTIIPFFWKIWVMTVATLSQEFVIVSFKIANMCSQYLLNILECQPDTYLDELQEELELQGISISLASLCRYMDQNGMMHKWVSSLAPWNTFTAHTIQLLKISCQQDHFHCAEFRDMTCHRLFPLKRVLLILQTRAEISGGHIQARRLMWCLLVNGVLGQWSHHLVVLELQPSLCSHSILPEICHDGMLHANIIEGSFDVITFCQFICGLLDHMNLFPGPNSVILLDNASICHSRETLSMITDW